MSITEPQQVRRRSLWVLALAVIIPVILVVGVLWVVWVQLPRYKGQAYTHELMLRTSGLSQPTHNKLDARFTDADHDLVADPPADAKDQIDPPVLVLSYVAVEDPEPFKVAFAEFAAHLAATTGKKVEYRGYTTTTDQLKAMRDGELHVAGFNTGAVPIAVNLCGFVPVCKLASADGTASYRMHIIVPADSAIKSVEDLRGHEITLTEPGSNSGYKAPLALLRSGYRMEPERDYILRYSAGHDESIRGIANKSYQAAAVAGDVWQRVISHGEIKDTQCRSIYESETFPTAAMGHLYNLKPELAAKVRDAFYSFEWKNTGLEREFATADHAKFIPANFKDDWALIRRIDNDMGVTYKLD